MSELTRLLSAIEQGDPRAAAQLLPLVYDELRPLAAARLAAEKPRQTLQATALVPDGWPPPTGAAPWASGRNIIRSPARKKSLRPLNTASTRRDSPCGRAPESCRFFLSRFPPDCGVS